MLDAIQRYSRPAETIHHLTCQTHANPYQRTPLGPTIPRMSKTRGCPRCGLELSRDTWRDRHPAAAVCAGVFVGLPAGYTLVGIMLIWPWFTIPATIIVCAVLLNRAARKRAAIAARAEWEHREMMVRAMQQFPSRPLPGAQQMRREAWQPRVPLPPTPQNVGQMPVRPRNPAPWHVVTQWSTERFRRIR